MPAAQRTQEEAAGGSIHNQDRLRSSVGLQKALILAVFMNVGACSETVSLAGLKSRGGSTKSASFEKESGPQNQKTKGECNNEH